MKTDKANHLFRLIRSIERKSPTSVWALLGFIERLEQIRLYGCTGAAETRGTSQATHMISAREKRKRRWPIA
jgi:hypothetical protein